MVPLLSQRLQSTNQIFVFTAHQIIHHRELLAGPSFQLNNNLEFAHSEREWVECALALFMGWEMFFLQSNVCPRKLQKENTWCPLVVTCICWKKRGCTSVGVGGNKDISHIMQKHSLVPHWCYLFSCQCFSPLLTHYEAFNVCVCVCVYFL